MSLQREQGGSLSKMSICRDSRGSHSVLPHEVLPLDSGDFLRRGIFTSEPVKMILKLP